MTSEWGEVCYGEILSALYECRQLDLASTFHPALFLSLSLSSIIYGQFPPAGWECSLPARAGVSGSHSFSGYCRIVYLALHNESEWQVLFPGRSVVWVSLVDTSYITYTRYSSGGWVIAWMDKHTGRADIRCMRKCFGCISDLLRTFPVCTGGKGYLLTIT